MRLTRPLITFDLETTGVSVYSDRIVQFAAVKLYPDGRVTEWQTLVNPKRPVPEGATAVHGITDAMVQDAPSFWDLSRKLERAFAGCDIAGFNVVRFDWPMLEQEFKRVGVAPPEVGAVVDAMKVFHRFAPRNLDAASRQYLGRPHEKAHEALSDARATLEILKAQVERHSEMPDEPEAIAKWLESKEAGNAA